MDTRPLRIALISEHASPIARIGSVDAGGQNIYVAEVARSLARDGHQVDVLTRRDDPSLPASVDVCSGMRVLNVPAGPAQFVPKEQLLPHMPAFIRQAQELFRHSVPYDVMHANFFMSGLAALRLREVFGVPMVMTFHALGLVRREHQGAADTFPPTRINVERRIVRGADALIAECPQDRDDLIRLYEADPRNISMVPCGVDPDEFKPMPRAQARRELGLPDDAFIVLQLGRLVPRKGIDNVIRAIALMDPAIPAQLIVVGGESADADEVRTPEIGRLRQLAQACGVGERVHFTGRRARSDLRTYYAAADAFVSTPWYEPFGITPLEAMACGTPVIGSAVGGIQYSVVDGVTGLLVPPRDAAALAQALSHLHANPALARAFGRAGIRRVRSMFTWDRVAGTLVDVYRGIETVREDLHDHPWERRGRQVWDGVDRSPVWLSHRNGVSVQPPWVLEATRRAGPATPRRPDPIVAAPAATLRAGAGRPAVFLDKDGTLVEDVPYNVDPARLRFTPRALPALRLLAEQGFALVMVTNQSGLATGRFRAGEFDRLRAALERRLDDEGGIRLTGFHVCPHAPDAHGAPACACRKPAPGLLQQAALMHGIDLEQSWMVGDILDDVEAGRRAGCRSVLLDVGNETQWLPSPLRVPDHRCADLWEAAQLITQRGVRVPESAAERAGHAQLAAAMGRP